MSPTNPSENQLNATEILQLVQQEKTATLSHLVSSVVHEINNPLGCIAGNITYIKDYVKDLLNLIELYQEHYPNPVDEITDEIDSIDLEYLIEDVPKLLSAMENGAERLHQISNSLRTFGRFEGDRQVLFNIHDGINSVLLMLKSRFKGTKIRSPIEVVKNYGNIPEINCYPGHFNQAISYLINHGINSLDKKAEAHPSDPEFKPTITIKTDLNQDSVLLSIQDNSLGISDDVQNAIFEDLLITKPVLQGSGIGLSVSRQIIEDRHQGKILCRSLVGTGTEFIIELPLSL
ncbi:MULTISPECIES: sensor histidine kinase [Planktothrix]|uniref:sensor histidine kinase n=1 Tax=Planktothrix TaxID=54304 RepID=UPI0003FA0056|nr:MULTISPECIES: ATP-binding protein [Planktothrix]